MIPAFLSRGISSGTRFRFEGLCIVLGLLLAWFGAWRGIRAAVALERRLLRLSLPPARAIAISALLPVALRLLLLPFLAAPEPWIQEEFSYLLAGDTFAHGR